MDYAVIGYVTVGIIFYVIAILTTFGRTLWERSTLGPTFGPLFMIGATSFVGLWAVVLGYLMILILGGSLSLGLASFIRRVTQSKQIIELFIFHKHRIETRDTRQQELNRGRG